MPVSNTKNILFISPQPFFQWRGSPIRVRFTLKSLSESGHTVDLLTVPFGEDEDIPNVRIIRAANIFRAKNMVIGPSLLKLGFDVIILFKAALLIRKHKYDVIHGIEEAGFIAALLAKIFGLQAVFEKHSDPLSYRKGFIKNRILSIYAAAEIFMVKHVNLVICTGTGLSRQVEKMGTAQSVHTIFDMPSSMINAEPSATAKISAELRQQQDEILVTYVGSFAVYQGVDLMFACIPKVHAISDRVRFVIIGGSPEEIEQRQATLAKEGVDDKVSFLGNIAPDKLPDYLAASDILLAPRKSGANSPLKVLDYYKAGKAIVATDVPSNHILLNKSSALFAQANPDSFAQEIIKLTGDASLREQLGANGRLLYEDKYTFSAFHQRLENAYAVLDNA